MDKERKLIWKYFWEQKTEELRNFFLFLGVTFMAFNIGFLFVEKVMGWGGDMINEPFVARYIIGGLVGGLVLLLGGGVLFLIGKGIVSWIQDNWEEAESRAKKEVENE